MTPEEAVKAIRAAERADLSFAGLITELIRRMPVDETGKPVWATEPHEQEELPKTG